MSRMLLYAAGRRRSPATDAGLQRGRVPRNKGRCYPADGRGDRRRHAPGRHRAPRSTDARADLLCSGAPGYASTKALAFSEADVDARSGAVLVRHGKGARRREVGMDDRPESNSSTGWTSASNCRRSAVLHPDRTDPRPRLVTGRRANDCATPRRSPACSDDSLRAGLVTPTPSSWRAGCRADRHPTPARTHQSRHHLDRSQGIVSAEIVDTVTPAGRQCCR
jgi:hypothetical protein